MIVDAGGALWLSNPWIAMAAMVLAVGLVVWCHRWLETGTAPLPRSAALRDHAFRVRALRHRQAIRPALVTVARFDGAARGSLLSRADDSPRNAA